MLLNREAGNRLDRLTEELRLAPALTRDLLSKVIEDVCTRLPAMRKIGRTAELDRLIGVGAWNDAVLALIALELPQWRLRRLVHEGGEWFCSLSQEPNLPAALDDTADAHHEVLPLAILSAFVEARRKAGALETGSSRWPQVRSTLAHAICCDNFS